jgi:hypothetical protein
VILCLVYYWQLNIDALAVVEGDIHASRQSRQSRQWLSVRHWIGPLKVSAVLFGLELCHDVIASMMPSKALDTFFTLWGNAVVTAVAFYCHVTARKLHTKLCDVVQFQAVATLFQRLIRGPLAIFALACGMLLLALLEIFRNQWFSWPHLLNWTAARCLEAMTLLSCLWTIGYVLPPSPSPNGTLRSSLRSSRTELAPTPLETPPLGPMNLTQGSLNGESAQ